MNRRYIVIVAIILGILALIVFRGCQKSPKRAEIPTPSLDSAYGHNDQQRLKEPTTLKEREAVVKEKSIEFAKRNNAPIAFYGRVIDQDSRPLQGVMVDFNVTAIPLIPVPWGPDETTKGSCVTNENGEFSVEGKRGVSFGVTRLNKSGFRESGYYEQGHARYEPYGSQRHIPDRAKPVDFMLIRDDIPKAKEVLNQRFKLNWNAGATTINLGPDTGKLEFTANRTGMDATNTMKKFDWNVHMRALGFTLIKLPEGDAKIAPQAGYAANSRVGFSSGEKSWSSEVIASYAILTNVGAYGLMKLTVHGNGEDGSISGRVTVYLNESGSRNIDHK